jgi:GST-like protein
LANAQWPQGDAVSRGNGDADLACYPWVVPYALQQQTLEDFPNLKRWFESIRTRPATVRAYAKAEAVNPTAKSTMDDEARKHLFGQDARTVRT